MSGIFLTDTCRLKSYSASTKGARSTIKIEIDVADHRDLGFVLRELAEIEAEQNAKEKAQRKPAAAKAARPLALPSPLLQLPYYDEEGPAE
ncbi:MULTISPECIES: hypothetical protein [unclassified Ensifer]|uniref:hypothetical protein n=1 Tax=unclassified Ensifer TaxID=2633371 RepID=UPI00081337ED|nr:MULTISPECIES: hypothetical protein [unclassified Ensifer]OCP17459.1 hypothetical protein BC361_08360 [Ensifer sp. LC54]OCP28635.1 hypothetical protein BC363_01995 [Ensifer sp. LC384]